MPVAFPRQWSGSPRAPAGVPELDPEAEGLIADLTSLGGLDFASYQRASLLRRLSWRMGHLGIGGRAAYRAYLRSHPDEHRLLCEAIPVHRTEFFRDPDAWAFLATEVIPRVLHGGGTVRAWSAGCATGEEAYTLAMLLAAAVGRNALDRRRVIVFGTDVSAAAVGRARAGRYRAEYAAEVPPDLRERYLMTDGGGWVVRPELRRAVAFTRHDLLLSPPLRGMHLVACRNTLMYFTVEAQLRVLGKLHRSLRPGGFLMVGRAEAPHVWSDLFRPENLRHRVYRKSDRGRGRRT